MAEPAEPAMDDLLALVEQVLPDAERIVTEYKDIKAPDDLAIDEAPKEDEQGHTTNLLGQYLHEMSLYPLITRDEERCLGLLIRKGDEKAIRKLVEANLRFVVFCAKRYRTCGLPFLDLIGAGNIGLIEVAKRYDPEKKTKFVTYAAWWIRQSITAAISNMSCQFRLPQGQRQLLGEIYSAQATLTPELDREATPEEIAAELGEKKEVVENVLRTTEKPLSLDQIADEEHDFRIGERIKDTRIPRADTTVLSEEMKERVLDALRTELEEREGRVILERFGFNGNRRTLKRIGEMVGLSRERIRQIEAKALEKLAASARFRELRKYLNIA